MELNYAFLAQCPTAPGSIRLSFSVGVHVEREKQTSKKQLIFLSLFNFIETAMFNVAKKRKRKGKGRESPEEVSKNPARAYLVHSNNRALTPRGPMNYNPVHCICVSGYYIANMRSVAASVELLSSLSGKKSLLQPNTSTEAQASPYQALALSSTYG